MLVVRCSNANKLERNVLLTFIRNKSMEYFVRNKSKGYIS